MKEKKDGVVWIVDLKWSKKLKGKQDTKMGFAKLRIWIYIEKKDKVSFVMDLKETRYNI